MRANGTRARGWVVLASVVAALFASAGAHAATCRLDADCGDGVDCNGIETCGPDGECRPGIGLCGPPTDLVGTQVSASSTYGDGYLPDNVIDGVDAADSSWCSGRGDSAPSIAVAWVVDAEIHEIRVLTSWSPGYDFLTARFRLFDAAGGTLFDSGSVALTNGEITLPLAPPVAGARRLEMAGETWRSADPCISEIELAAAFPCTTDADCAFASPCFGVGICLPSGTCSATAPRCRNLAPSYASLGASSSDAPYLVERIVDGVDSTSHSWCAAAGDTTPDLTLTLPNEHPVSVLRLTAPWVGYEIRTARITIEDAPGATLFDPGILTCDRGALDLVLDPGLTTAHRIDIEAVTTSAAPCVGELELLGEYCAIGVVENDPLTIAFRPGTPTPDFELRYGLLSELLSDGGFDRAVCLGRYSGGSVEPFLPDPDPGEGYYVIARGFNVCVDEGFGMSMATPDPRAALAAQPQCQP